MKSIVFVFLSLFATSAFANSLEAIQCKKAMLDIAFTKAIVEASMDELKVNNYSFGDFMIAPAPYDKKYEYLVTIISESRAPGSTPTYNVYGVKVIDVKLCVVDAGKIKE